MIASSHALSARAVPARHDGTTKKARESMMGAYLTAIQAVQDNVALPSTDALRVEPLANPTDSLWTWVQPLMSAGGHIIGAPKPKTQTREQVLSVGMQLWQAMEKGVNFESNRPEFAIPILMVLAARLAVECNDVSDLEVSALLVRELGPVLGYSRSPSIDEVYGEDYVTRFTENMKYPAVVIALKMFDIKSISDGQKAPPSWKEIKKSVVAQEVSISNKMARYVRRLITGRWPKKLRVWKIATIRRECLKPPSRGDTIVDFVENCWMLRPSSISCQLNKRPPSVVRQVLDKLPSVTDEQQDVTVQRARIVKKFSLFRKWVAMQHGEDSGPSVWSDTLSKFAASINCEVDRYNERVGHISLVHATSFVPGDLAPEMYRRGTCETGYFFLGGGWYYKYSEAWRRDAYSAYLQDRLPQSVTETLEAKAARSGDEETERLRKKMGETVSVDLAYKGGHELLAALAEVGVSELAFTTFLRKYYWSGAFLDVNLNSHDDFEVNEDDWSLVDTYTC